MSKIWYHPDTGAYVPVEDSIVVVVPDHFDDEKIDEYLGRYDTFWRAISVG